MPDTAALIAYLDRFAQARIACLGDVMLDRFSYGSADRLSPEAPIPVLRVERHERMLGGAGNVVRNLVALGARASLIAVIGDDEAGREIEALAAEEPGLDARLAVEPGRPTTVKTRFVAAGQQLLRADAETSEPLRPDTVPALLALVDDVLPNVDVLVLSDYAKGVLGDAVLKPVIARARALGKTIIADPKRSDFAAYRGVQVLTPNVRELAAATRMACRDDGEVTAAATDVMTEAGIDAVMVTRSERGLSLVARDGSPLHLKADAREVFDVSGAGDTVVATMAVALAAGAELGHAARLANTAGGIVVGKVGTAAVRAEDLSAALRTAEVSSSEAKIVSAAVAADRVRQWRAAGLKVGFTNGCFDLLHPGHVSLLRQARAAADRLVVALNGDGSVRRLKGPERPIQPETARAIVLASLQAVDLVVIFGEDTPLELIRLLRPDLLVKGADYTIETVVGAHEVQSWGGTVLLAELEAGHSTSGVIDRMNGRRKARAERA